MGPTVTFQSTVNITVGALDGLLTLSQLRSLTGALDRFLGAWDRSDTDLRSPPVRLKAMQLRRLCR